jgi:glycosyltransferase involved in cell wall biosynthesis
LLVRITTAPISLKILLKGQLGFMRVKGFKVVAISSDGPEIQDIVENEKVDHIIVPFTRTITPFQDLRCLFNLIRLFRNLKPDIVHTHTPKAGLIGMLAARVAGVSVRMHTVAGMPLTEYKGILRILLEWGERWTYRNATQVFPNSKGLEKFILERHWISKNKVKTIGNGSSNGIDTSHFSLESISSGFKLQASLPDGQASGNNPFKLEVRSQKSEGQIDKGNFVYSFIGRLVRDKGIRELVEAFLPIYEKDKNLRLLLVGSYEDHREPLEQDVKNTIEEHPGILHAGFQEDIRPWLAMSDVFVFPSYREGFPNVVMQAGAMELPCIVTDIFGSNEIIEEGVNGLIVPSKNTEELRKSMERLKADHALRENLAANARERIVENYDQKKMWQLILEEYRKILLQSPVTLGHRDSQSAAEQLKPRVSSPL